MKKTYSKPELFYESFSLLGSIASSCDNLQHSANDATTCAVEVPDLGWIFSSTVTGCQVTGMDDKICQAGTAAEAFTTISGS